MPYIYDASENSDLIKEGDYEVVIERMERKTLPSGKEKLSIMYRVRTDVEQSSKNRCVFEDIWEEKDNPGVFNRKRINQLLGTQDIEDGQSFETINDVIDFLIGGYLIAHIVVTLNTYRGEDENTVSFYKSSKVKPQSLGTEERDTREDKAVKPISVKDVFADKRKEPPVNLVVDDDEVPF